MPTIVPRAPKPVTRRSTAIASRAGWTTGAPVIGIARAARPTPMISARKAPLGSYFLTPGVRSGLQQLSCRTLNRRLAAARLESLIRPIGGAGGVRRHQPVVVGRPALQA